MGRGVTIHVLGYGLVGRAMYRMYHAMNRLEMRQLLHKAELLGDVVVEWEAQTERGCRILGSQWIGERVKTPQSVKDLRVVPCPRCSHFPYEQQGCDICNFSGIITKAHLRKYTAWQLQPCAEPRITRVVREDHG